MQCSYCNLTSNLTAGVLDPDKVHRETFVLGISDWREGIVHQGTRGSIRGEEGGYCGPFTQRSANCSARWYGHRSCVPVGAVIFVCAYGCWDSNMCNICVYCYIFLKLCNRTLLQFNCLNQVCACVWTSSVLPE